MAEFYKRLKVEMEVDEFLTQCSVREIENLIEALIEDGWIKASQWPLRKSPNSSQKKKSSVNAKKVK